MKLVDIWPGQDLDLKEFAEQLGMSRSTVGRIMTAERRGEKYPMSPRMAGRLAKSLGKMLKCELKTEDLEGVELAPPRPGRPRKR
jgi:plasmid maintenance system antidote protein VapI